MKRKMTFIELLVLVAVVAILLAFLLPAISGPRDRKRKAACMSNLKQIGLACHLYSNDNKGAFPFVRDADDSNDSFYVLFPTYMTWTRPFACPDEASCRKPAAAMTKVAFDVPGVVSYAYVTGLSENNSGDSPLAGDHLMNPSKANDTTVQQFQKRIDCSTQGSGHGGDSGNVVFVDGHASFNNPGTQLKVRWVDDKGGASLIKNPNGLQ